MVKFAYNNFKNASMDHTSFELNCGYHSYLSCKDKCDARSRSSLAKELAMELRELMNVCHQNFLHIQDLQKEAYDERVKPQSYALGEKV